MEWFERRAMLKGWSATAEEIPSDQQAGVAQPPMAKEYEGATAIDLPRDFDGVLAKRDVWAVLSDRTSHRAYTQEAITLVELAFLLWCVQGVKSVIGKKSHATLRMVPSAGARHALEAYVAVNNVEGLQAGLYHYRALEHKLERLDGHGGSVEVLCDALGAQSFVKAAAVNFIFTLVPYRMEWRYGPQASKYALLDAGHVMQNLYLACEAIACGTCAIGAYEQEKLDRYLGLGEDHSAGKEAEFAVYAASVGKV